MGVLIDIKKKNVLYLDDYREQTTHYTIFDRIKVLIKVIINSDWFLAFLGAIIGAQVTIFVLALFDLINKGA